MCGFDRKREMYGCTLAGEKSDFSTFFSHFFPVSSVRGFFFSSFDSSDENFALELLVRLSRGKAAFHIVSTVHLCERIYNDASNARSTRPLR